MALNPELLSFFISKIHSATMETFGSEANHIYEHLFQEVKDNPVFDQYEFERKEWAEMLENDDWKLPNEFQKAKSMAYAAYKKIADKGENAWHIPVEVIGGRGDYNNKVDAFNRQYLGYFEQALNDISRANPEIELAEIEKVKGNRVFIVHGHDELLKSELQLLLTRAGVNNLVLHEQADKGRTIIDKLVEESKGANYAIALISPDDKLESGQARARQNVILEIGYFMGKLGKERVRLLKKGDVEIPSDLQGVLYENYDKAGAWKFKLLKEIQAVGIYVNMQEVASLF